MCGRYVLSTPDQLPSQARALPGVESVVAPQGLPGPRYNIAPTQPIPIVRIAGEEAFIEPARWGFTPRWEGGQPLFNARAETVADKPSFRGAYQSRRCLIPMTGYYEWHQKLPYFVTIPSGAIMWAAGLWQEEAGGPAGLLTATMVTTAAVDKLAWLHNRSPKFLLPEEAAAWCGGQDGLLAPRELAGIAARRVGREVGNVRNDYPGLADPVETIE